MGSVRNIVNKLAEQKIKTSTLKYIYYDKQIKIHVQFCGSLQFKFFIPHLCGL